MSVYGYGGSLNGEGPSLGGTPWVGGSILLEEIKSCRDQ